MHRIIPFMSLEKNSIMIRVYYPLLILFLLFSCITNLSAQPSNDTPEMAIDLDGVIAAAAGEAHGWSCEATERTYTTPGAVPTACTVAADGVAPNGGAVDCDLGTINDIWYKFTGGANVWLDFYSHQTNNMNVTLALYSGTPVTTTTPTCSVSGLTFIACINRAFGDDNNTDSGGTNRSKSFCTTPTHSKIDISGLTNGTVYYVRLWHDGATLPTEGQFYVCAESSTTISPAVDNCTQLGATPFAPSFGCADGSAEGKDVNILYSSMSNAGGLGNSGTALTIGGTGLAVGCSPENSILAVGGAAGDVDYDCNGGIAVPPIYLNNVVNNNVMYVFNVDACSPGFQADACLEFTNMQACCGGGVIQIQIIGPLAGDGTDQTACEMSGPVVAAFSVNPDNNSCVQVCNNTAGMINGTFIVMIEGQNGILVEYDMRLTIDYSGCTPEPEPCTTAIGPGVVTLPPAALPVELTYFGGEKDRTANVLAWTTASETNNAFFTIERSEDGKHFEALSDMEGSGNSSEEKRYVYYDNQPLETSYYRLKQVDFDGQFTYSKIVVIDRKVENITIKNIYPTPTKDEITIEFKALTAGPAYIVVQDVFGKTVMSQSIDTEQNIQSQTINLEGLPNSVYFVSINQGSNRVTKRIMKY